MDGPTWRSRIAPVELPPVFVDGEALRVAERHAHKPAVIDALTGRSLTFGQLLDGARRLAGARSRRPGRAPMAGARPAMQSPLAQPSTAHDVPRGATFRPRTELPPVRPVQVLYRASPHCPGHLVDTCGRQRDQAHLVSARVANEAGQRPHLRTARRMIAKAEPEQH